MPGSNSEALVISALLRGGDPAAITKHGLTADLFITYEHEWKWIEKRLKKTDALPSVVALRQQYPSFVIFAVDDIDSFADQLRHDAAQAKLTDLMDDCITLMESGSVKKALTNLGNELLTIQSLMTDTPEHFDMKADWQDTYDDVAARVDRVNLLGTAGVPTGFSTLDMNSGGLQPGWLCIVGGRLGEGKTWTMVRMAAEAAMRGYKAMYWSLEQGRHQIAMRAQSIFAHEANVTGIRVTDLMRGTGVSLDAYKSFMENEMQSVCKGDLLINDTTRGKVNTMTIASSIEAVGPDIVFIDYLTLLEMQGDGDWQSVANLSGDLKRISERYSVPIVAGSQLNRTAVKDDTPDPGTLARSDSIGQDADMVITIARDKVTPVVRKLNLAKFRHGPDGFSWHCKFQPGQGVYEEITGDEAERLRELARDVD